MPEDFKVLIEAGHVDFTHGTNPRVWLEKKYRRCVCERMVKGIMSRCDNFLSSMAIRCRWKLCKKCRPDWRIVKRQAAKEAEQQKSSEETLLGRGMTEAEFEDMLTEKEIHGTIFARSRCHGGSEDILDGNTPKRCRCSGCEKPLPAKTESADRVRWRRQFREERKPGPSEPFDVSAPHHYFVWNGAPDHSASSGW